MEHGQPDPVGAGRVLVTGAGGQLGAALREAFPDADARPRAELDVTEPIALGYAPGLVLHAAAWTDVDGAEADEAGALRANVEGTRNVAALGAPLVYYSSDYVFDGSKREPYLESDEPAPLGAYGRSKLLGEREVRDGLDRPELVALRLDRPQLRADDASPRGRAGRGRASSTTSAAARPTSGTWPPRRGSSLALPRGVWHVAADGECTWAEFAEAIFEEAGLDCRVVRISTEELDRPAPRPAYSVLRSERQGAPQLPHWREGLRECLARL